MANDIGGLGTTNSPSAVNVSTSRSWGDRLFGWLGLGGSRELDRIRPAGTNSSLVDNSISVVLSGLAKSGLNIATNVSTNNFLQTSNFEFRSKTLNKFFAERQHQERRYNAPLFFGGKETFMHISLSNVKGPVLIRTAQIVEPSFDPGRAGQGEADAYVFFQKYYNGCKDKSITTKKEAIDRAKAFLQDIGLKPSDKADASSSVDFCPVRSIARQAIQAIPEADFNKVKQYFINLQQDPNADILVFSIIAVDKINGLEIEPAIKKLFQEDGQPLFWVVKFLSLTTTAKGWVYENSADPTAGVIVTVLPDGKVIGFGNYTGWNQAIENKAKTGPR